MEKIMKEERQKQIKEIDWLYKNRSRNVAVVGVGNMGGAIVEGVVAKGLKEKEEMILTNRTRSDLDNYFLRGFNVMELNQMAVMHADTIFISVKPWEVIGVLKEAKPYLTKDKTIISVAAGVTLQKMEGAIEGTGATVVRAMPNLAAILGLGVTGWYCNKQLSFEQEQLITTVFDSMGLTIKTKTEDGIDRITAVAGSMIGFSFYLSEVMQESTKCMLQEEVSQQGQVEIARQVAKGAFAMLQNDGRTPGELRQAVTSKNGTTYAGLSYFENAELAQTFLGGVNAAYERSKEIGKEL